MTDISESSKPNLPPGFKPYQVLTVCSNEMVNGIAPFVMDGHYPILVGRGHNKRPAMWLFAPTQPDLTEWAEIVTSNKPLDPRFLISFENEASLTLKFGENIILKANQEDDDRATITFLDLQSLGLLIQGTTDSLTIGGMVMSHNSSFGSTALVSLGGPKSA